MRKPLRQLYDCSKCPAWCCSYPNIFVNGQDLTRLARHFGITEDEAQAKFTRMSPDYKRPIVKHKKDDKFGSVCRFLDSKSRRCTIYHARPLGCRTYPGGRCGYYEFLKIERDRQRDDDHIATTDHRICD